MAVAHRRLGFAYPLRRIESKTVFRSLFASGSAISIPDEPHGASPAAAKGFRQTPAAGNGRLGAPRPPRPPSTLLVVRQHGGRSGGRSFAMRARMWPKSSRGTATSAIWKMA